MYLLFREVGYVGQVSLSKLYQDKRLVFHDLDEKGFDRIVEAVTAFALTPMGADRLTRLQPSPDAGNVARLLGGTSETRRYLQSNALFPFRSASE